MVLSYLYEALTLWFGGTQLCERSSPFSSLNFFEDNLSVFLNSRRGVQDGVAGE